MSREPTRPTTKGRISKVAPFFRPTRFTRLAVTRHLAGLAARDVRPLVGLLAPGGVAAHLEAEGLLRALLEAQQAEGDGQLGGPAVRRLRGLTHPVAVPVPGIPGVVEAGGVGDHARGVDGELERGGAVAAGRERDAHRVGLDLAVAAREGRDELRCPLHAFDGHVDGPVVVEDADAGGLARGLTVVGDLLREGAGDGRVLPDGVVGAAVHDRSLVRAPRAELRPGPEDGGRENERRDRPHRRPIRRSRPSRPRARSRGRAPPHTR